MTAELGRRAPALGNVEIRRDGDQAWAVYRDGELAVAGLDFQQVLAIVRGELQPWADEADQ